MRTGRRFDPPPGGGTTRQETRPVSKRRLPDPRILPHPSTGVKTPGLQRGVDFAHTTRSRALEATTTMEYSDVYWAARAKQDEAREQILTALGVIRDLRVIVRQLRLTRAGLRDTANQALAESFEREIPS